MTLNDFEIFQKKQFLISELQRFYREEGFVPIQSEMTTKNGYPSYTTYYIYFGSWNNALEEAGLEINQYLHKHDGTEICINCNKRANEIVGFRSWYYSKNDDNKRHCNKCGDSNGIFHYKEGILNINSSKGRGRAGEITVIKALKIGDEHDCARLSCGYPFDLYHKEKYKKINIKTSVFNNDYNRWQFEFRAEKVADTYICLGMSYDTKKVEHVWVVPNEDEIRELTGFHVSNGNLSLKNHKYWEVDNKPYNKAWQEMLENYADRNCKVFGKKIVEQTKEQEEKYQQFKKEFFEKYNLKEVIK